MDNNQAVQERTTTGETSGFGGLYLVKYREF